MLDEDSDTENRESKMETDQEPKKVQAEEKDDDYSEVF